MDRMVTQRANALQLWRREVHGCRTCHDKAARDPSQIASGALLSRAQVVHHESSPATPGERRGWAMPLLDKDPDPDYELALLERSCSSRVVVVMEAPNYADTYELTKGYLTCDTVLTLVEGTVRRELAEAQSNRSRTSGSFEPFSTVAT